MQQVAFYKDINVVFVSIDIWLYHFIEASLLHFSSDILLLLDLPCHFKKHLCLSFCRVCFFFFATHSIETIYL